MSRKMKKMQSLYWLGPRLNDAVGQGNDGHNFNAGKYENEKHQQ